jgi:hypothetical protein
MVTVAAFVATVDTPAKIKKLISRRIRTGVRSPVCDG